MIKIYDAIVIGSGAAAYGAADWLFRENVTDIAVVCENRLSGTSRNTGSDKQTYYKLSMDGFSQDSPYKMASDIFAAGTVFYPRIVAWGGKERKEFSHLMGKMYEER